MCILYIELLGTILDIDLELTDCVVNVMSLMNICIVVTSVVTILYYRLNYHETYWNW